MSMPGQHRPIAIAPTSQVPPSLQQDEAAVTPTMPYTCVTCAKRKVKCDKSGPPCSTCRKGRHECQYEAPAPRKRKRKALDDVHERLERAEDLLRQHGLSVSLEKSSPREVPPSNPTQAPHITSSGSELRTGKLLAGHGKTRYIDSTLWHGLSEQEMNMSDEEEDDDDAGEQQHLSAHSISPSTDPVTAAVFTPQTPIRQLVDVHPTYEIAMKLWQIYVSHVEPLTKTFHVASGRAMMQRAASNPGSMPKAVECLVFAVYHFAVAAMSEDECFDVTGQSRSVLQPTYYDATRQALVNAHFLRTAELTVLHAYVIFLLAVRQQYDPHTFWILTGVAHRIGQRIGVHRNGEELGLKPFDAEMRRRLFWVMLPLEGMAAQLAGARLSMPTQGVDAAQPLNIDDDDLYADMTELPAGRQGATDMIFIRTRTTMGMFHAKWNPYAGEWIRLWEVGDFKQIEAIEAGMTEVETSLETTILRYCDVINPVHCLVMAMARAALCLGRLRIRAPREKVQGVSVEHQRDLISLAMKMVDYVIATRANPGIRKFDWHLHSYFQWEPIIWVLNELRRSSPGIVDYQTTWDKIGAMYTGWPEYIVSKRALHVAVARLTLKAWHAHPAPDCATDPAFITALKGAVGKREASRSVNNDPTPQSNLWAPETADIALQQDLDGAGVGNDPMMAMGNGSADAIDWMFWDQLIRDPDAFPTS